MLALTEVSQRQRREQGHGMTCLHQSKPHSTVRRCVIHGIILLILQLSTLDRLGSQQRIEFTRLHSLGADESAFAYARISPDGRFLAYASDSRVPRRPSFQQVINVVDLASGNVVFTEPGIDPYWSVDGRRMIFLSRHDDKESVTIRDYSEGTLTRGVAPPELGDYYSWGVRDGRDVVLTINSNFYFLDNSKAVLPAQRVPPCEGIGVGSRPLLSKDGRRLTAFVRGMIIVRNLTDCRDILETGATGAKADFSWDGRYIAYHSPKRQASGYEVQIVDLQRKTVRTVTELRGSSLFPSWTRDGRLMFYYEDDEFRGFLLADGSLTAPERPLPTVANLQAANRWSDVFPSTPLPRRSIAVVMIWSPWSAHSPDALRTLQGLAQSFDSPESDVEVFMAVDESSRRSDAEKLLRRHEIRIREIPITPAHLALTGARNQIPASLVFRRGVLIDQRLGAQSREEFRDWVLAARDDSADR